MILPKWIVNDKVASTMGMTAVKLIAAKPKSSGQGLGRKGAGLESFDRQAVHEEDLFKWLAEADVRGAYQRRDLRGLQH